MSDVNKIVTPNSGFLEDIMYNVIQIKEPRQNLKIIQKL